MRPTPKYVKFALDYIPSTGIFRWKIRGRGRQEIAGTKINNSGRRGITLGANRYPSAVLAYVYMTGRWPAGEIDHIDGDPSNDRWQNLRPASRSQQLANRKCMGNSTSGIKGIYKNKNGTTWNARIRVKGKRLFVGNFATASEAHSAYCAAARKHYGEFARAV